MENQNGRIGLRVMLGTLSGLLVIVTTLMINLFIGVSKDAQIAIGVAAQHGDEINGLRTELQLVRETLREGTADRYRAAEAARDQAYLEKRIEMLEKELAKHHP